MVKSAAVTTTLTVALTAATAAFAPSALAAGGYTEIWNPPEARLSAPHKIGVARKPVRRRHVAAHASRALRGGISGSPARLMAKQNAAPKSLTAPTPVPPHEPDVTDIPRQITPEGNVLRVSAQTAPARVVR